MRTTGIRTSRDRTSGGPPVLRNGLSQADSATITVVQLVTF